MFDCFLLFLMQESLVQDKLYAQRQRLAAEKTSAAVLLLQTSTVQVLQICKKFCILF